MRLHDAVEPQWATPPSPSRRHQESGAPGVLLGLQRSAGNAAVAAHLAAPHGRADPDSPMAFVQRCGPTPCNCSAEERADYAEHHPDEPVIADTGGTPGGSTHRNG